ncbi:hypothetical protein GOV05_01500 [Candidatus Woesearchaeota archaeon]|nr:hypothetical protein [Candidatus Woesearchaeota archaeon]
MTNKIINRFIVIFLLVLTLTTVSFANIPTGPTITYNTSETINPTPSTLINTSGGSFTTLLLNMSSQNYRWKAYVGNVSGKLTLDDSGNKTIYDWQFSVITGNVYATRNSTNPDWSNISCANRNSVYGEETYLNINTTKEDSINTTFRNSVHKTFYAANNLIQNSTCPAIATYVNDSSQSSGENAVFQEVLLEDTNGILIYTTIIENNVLGFDLNPYDFQMIVADDESTDVVTPYYFYVELS